MRKNKDQFPEVEIEIVSTPVHAKSRKLKGTWYVDDSAPPIVYYYCPPTWWQRLWAWLTRPFRKKGKEELC